MSRKTMTLIVAAAVFAGALIRADAPDPFFPVAVWYSGGTARAPMLGPVGPGSEAAWRKDLAAIKSLGFNTVRTWVEWSAAEAREGEYRFDQLELLLRLAGEAGLRVIVQVYVDSAPEWVGRKFPDGQFVSQGGTVIRSQAAPGFCFDHPGVRRAVLSFFEEVARQDFAERHGQERERGNVRLLPMDLEDEFLRRLESRDLGRPAFQEFRRPEDFGRE